MKKLFLITLIVSLTGCGGGSGGGSGGSGAPIEPENPNIPNIDPELTAAELLFGQGNGIGEIPTELLARTDNLGFEYLSFGAWGNVYDLVETETPKGMIYGNVYGQHIDFTAQQLAEINAWNKPKDASVADSTFKGPAIMYYMPGNPSGPVSNQDYGTMQLSFGHDITNYVLEFIMHNPENNLEFNSVIGIDETYPDIHYYSNYFSDDMQNVVVKWQAYEDNGHNARFYHGYGTKQ